MFAPGSDQVELLQLLTTSTEEVVSRSKIEEVLANYSPTMANKNSPKMTKTKLPKAQQKMQSQFEGLTIDHFPKVSKGSLGQPSRLQQFLEVSPEIVKTRSFGAGLANDLA